MIDGSCSNVKLVDQLFAHGFCRLFCQVLRLWVVHNYYGWKKEHMATQRDVTMTLRLSQRMLSHRPRHGHVKPKARLGLRVHTTVKAMPQTTMSFIVDDGF